MTRKLVAYWLGQRDYRSVHAFQERLASARRSNDAPDTVLFLEHDPVITLGRGAKREHILLDAERRKALGIDCVETGRGGDVTLHAPGQLVCYPIIELSPEQRDVRRYVKNLTETMRRVVSHYGVQAGILDPHIGLWVDRAAPGRWLGSASAADPAKIGAIGVRISRWVTTHGFALNLTVDLSLFSAIVPCGIRAHGVTSLQELTRTRANTREVADLALDHLAGVLGFQRPGLCDLTPESAGPEPIPVC